MKFALSAEQDEFAAVLHKLLDTADVPAAADAWANGDPAAGRRLWRRLAEVGVTALAVPATWGGLGAEPADLVVACEELGHHGVPGPLAESLAAVPALLATLSETGKAGDILAGLAGGHLVATLAAPPWLPYAVDADGADVVLLAEPDAVRFATTVAVSRSVDPTRRLFRVRAGAVLAAGPPVAAAVAGALDLGALACAAQLLGAGRAMLELAAGYARQRTQFGRPIGQNQAVAHQLADVAVAVEFARPLLLAAAVALATGSPTAARDVSAAKVACGQAAHRSARAALQVHGAIGYTEEYGLARWLTKVRAMTLAWGTPSAHRARVMATLRADRDGAP